MFWVKGF